MPLDKEVPSQSNASTDSKQEASAEHDSTLLGDIAHTTAEGLGATLKGLHTIGKHIPKVLHPLEQCAEVIAEICHDDTSDNAVENLVCGTLSGVAKLGVGTCAVAVFALVPEIEIPVIAGAEVLTAAALEGMTVGTIGTAMQQAVDTVTKPVGNAVKKVCHAAFDYCKDHIIDSDNHLSTSIKKTSQESSQEFSKRPVSKDMEALKKPTNEYTSPKKTVGMTPRIKTTFGSQRAAPSRFSISASTKTSPLLPQKKFENPRVNRAAADAETKKLNLPAATANIKTSNESKRSTTMPPKLESKLTPKYEKLLAKMEAVLASEDLTPDQKAIIVRTCVYEELKSVQLPDISPQDADSLKSMSGTFTSFGQVAQLGSYLATKMGSDKGPAIDKLAKGAAMMGAAASMIATGGLDIGSAALFTLGLLQSGEGLGGLFGLGDDKDDTPNPIFEQLKAIIEAIAALARQIFQLGKYIEYRFNQLEKILGDNHREVMHFLRQALFDQTLSLADIRTLMQQYHGDLAQDLKALLADVQLLLKRQRDDAEVRMANHDALLQELTFLQTQSDKRVVDQVKAAIKRPSELAEHFETYSQQLSLAIQDGCRASDALTGTDLPINFKKLNPAQRELLERRWLLPLNKASSQPIDIDTHLQKLMICNIDALVGFATQHNSTTAPIRDIPHLLLLADRTQAFINLHQTHKALAEQNEFIPSHVHAQITDVMDKLNKTRQDIRAIDVKKVLTATIGEFHDYYKATRDSVHQAQEKFELEYSKKILEKRKQRLLSLSQLLHDLPPSTTVLIPKENQICTYRYWPYHAWFAANWYGGHPNLRALYAPQGSELVKNYVYPLVDNRPPDDMGDYSEDPEYPINRPIIRGPENQWLSEPMTFSWSECKSLAEFQKKITTQWSFCALMTCNTLAEVNVDNIQHLPTIRDALYVRVLEDDKNIYYVNRKENAVKKLRLLQSMHEFDRQLNPSCHPIPWHDCNPDWYTRTLNTDELEKITALTGHTHAESLTELHLEDHILSDKTEQIRLSTSYETRVMGQVKKIDEAIAQVSQTIKSNEHIALFKGSYLNLIENSTWKETLTLGPRLVRSAAGQRIKVPLYFHDLKIDQWIPRNALYAEDAGLGHIALSYAISLQDETIDSKCLTIKLKITFCPEDTAISPILLFSDSHAMSVSSAYQEHCLEDLLVRCWYGDLIFTEKRIDLTCDVFKHDTPLFKRENRLALAECWGTKIYDVTKKTEAMHAINAIVQPHLAQLRTQFHEQVKQEIESYSGLIGEACLKSEVLYRMLQCFTVLQLPSTQAKAIQDLFEEHYYTHVELMDYLKAFDSAKRTYLGEFIGDDKALTQKITSVTEACLKQVDAAFVLGYAKLDTLYQDLDAHLSTVTIRDKKPLPTRSHDLEWDEATDDEDGAPGLLEDMTREYFTDHDIELPEEELLWIKPNEEEFRPGERILPNTYFTQKGQRTLFFNHMKKHTDYIPEQRRVEGEPTLLIKLPTVKF